MAALALAHGASDMYMGFLPGLLPFLAGQLGLSLTRVGFTVATVNLVSNLLQPAFGHIGERLSRRWLAVVGPVVTAIAMSSLGLVHTYPTLLVALMIGGIGNALFHPVAASLVGSVARTAASGLRGAQRSGRLMALFIAGGSIGYGSGPLVVIGLVHVAGLSRTWVAASIGVAAALFVWTSISRQEGDGEQQAGPPVRIIGRHWWQAVITLYLVVMLRAAAATVFITFVPLLFQRRGEELALGGGALLAFSLAGAAGGMIGGHAVHRLGDRWVTAVSLGLGAPALLGFVHTEGAWAVALAAALGACISAALPANIVMAQQLMPRYATAASGLVMGTAWAVGSLGAPGVGALGDRLAVTMGGAAGLAQAMQWSAAIFVAGAAIACLLPDLARGPSGSAAVR